MIQTDNPLVSPWDEHNQALVANGHPADWVNPVPAGKYNLVVLGAGTAGLVTAAGAAALGAKVALVEKHLMGGDCLNVGCVPSKGLIRAARAWADVRDAGDFGVRVPDGATVDFPAVMERMRRLRARISPNDSVRRFSGLGVDVFLGEGKFISSDTVEVDGKKLRFAKAVLATGARAAAPPIPGLAEAGYLTNETLFSLTELPRRLAVIGAGPIGCEMSQAFARFGAQVFLLESSAQVLGREDRDAAGLVKSALDKDGVHFIAECKILRVEKSGDEKVLRLECRGDARELRVNQILVGVGRAPNVEGLGLDAVGVENDPRAGVKVDDHLRTTNPRIYAAGDVCFPFKFTHTAEALAAIVIQNALFKMRKKASDLVIPWCTYTDPEVAHVGMYEKDAAERGLRVDTYTHEFKDVDRALLDGEEAGFVRVHARKGTDRILGGTIVARHAGEMIGELTAAIVGGVGLKTLAGVIHPYPTQAEAIKRVAGAYMKSKLTPGVRRAMETWMRWTR